MNNTIRHLVGVLSLASFSLPAFASSINFDAQGFGVGAPSLFGSPAQTVVVTTDDLGNSLGGNITFTGGVILNQTTNLPADETAVYGSASYGNLSNPLTIAFNLGDPIHNFFLDVLNGQTFPTNFLLTDSNGDTATFTLPSNANSGLTTIGFAAVGDWVTVAQLDPATGGPLSGWDFFVDNIHFNEALPSVPDATSTAGLLLLGLVLTAFAGSRLPLRMAALVS
jgi:hypothetical protein